MLAKTLLYLSRNDEEYSAYLSWRSRYSLEIIEWPCYLCQALTEKLSRKSFNNEGSVHLAQEGLCTSWCQCHKTFIVFVDTDVAAK